MHCTWMTTLLLAECCCAACIYTYEFPKLSCNQFTIILKFQSTAATHLYSWSCIGTLSLHVNGQCTQTTSSVLLPNTYLDMYQGYASNAHVCVPPLPPNYNIGGWTLDMYFRPFNGHVISTHKNKHYAGCEYVAQTYNNKSGNTEAHCVSSEWTITIFVTEFNCHAKSMWR